MNGDSARRMINRILTAVAVVMMMVWAWKFFGPGSAHTRRSGMAALRGAGMDFSTLLWISIAVVCGGYLLWRFLGWLFWHKYFKGEKPPEDEE
ncbi:MAG: hypothetical protein LUG14_08975 [Synergistaceae bacterium]|nr:hypothetical protein [Synergistaceae bacterium]MCD8162656.1 hypothetical protein [Synergistaceae bacterium]